VSASDEAPDDVEEALTAYLTGLRTTAISRRPRDPLPFNLIRNIGGGEDPELGFSDPLVSVRTLCDKKLGEDVAAGHCAETHKWMINLARVQEDIAISGGRIVNFDYVTVVEMPHWIEFPDDQVLCKLGRYGIGLSYVKQP
jgi:hypothetical protein